MHMRRINPVNLSIRHLSPESARSLRVLRSALSVLVIVMLASVFALAQADFEKGYQSYQSYHGTDFDTINLANGNLVLNIPLVSYEQRGGLPPVTISIRSNSTTFQSDPPFSSGPADTKQFEVPAGVLGSPAGQPHVVISPGGLYWKEQRITLEKAQLSRFVAYDDSGASHSLGSDIANSTAPYLGNIRYSIDGSDIMLTASATNPVVIDRRGNKGGLVDPNGNAITLQGPCAKPAGSGQFYNASLPPWEGYAFGTASATTIVDSIGRVIPNPTYIEPLASYSCLVDLDKPYYPATTSSDSSCPVAQAAGTIPGETGVALGPTGQPLLASDAYNFPSQNGGTIQLKFCYQKINVSAALPNVTRKTTQINEVWPVLTGVILPNNTVWVFVYDTYGQVIQITMPTGATMAYAYGGSTNSMRIACGNPPGEIPVSGTPTWPFNNLMSSRMVTQRTLTSTNLSGIATTQQWTYNSTIGSGWGASPNQGNVTVTDAMGNDIVHTFSLIGTSTYGQPICGPYETNVAYYQGSSTATTPVVIKQVATQYTSTGIDHANPTNFSNYIANNVLPSTVTTTLYDGLGGIQVQQDAYGYDKFGTYQDYKCTTYPFSMGQKLVETESDFGAGGPGSILRTSLFTNQWQSYWTYYAANLVDLPCVTMILTGTYSGTQSTCTPPLNSPPSNQAAQTIYYYDFSGYVPAGAIGLETALYRWGNAYQSSISYTYYNAQGMPTEKVDPNGNPTFIAYDGTGLYPNKITHPQTGTVVHVEIPTYDMGTGELLAHQDENQNTTSFQYDEMRRPLTTSYPDGGQEKFTYNDVIPPSYVFNKKLSNTSTFTETGLADTLGRKVQTQITDPQGTLFANTTYDTLGRVAAQTNPFRSTSESTYGVTAYTYDAIGRKTIETQPDGSKQMWCYQDLATNAQTNCNAQLAKTGSTASTGSFVDFRDESFRDWQRTSDGLGRLASVMEPNGNTNAPSMQTTYNYDALDNLTQVTQTGNGQDTPRFSRQFFFDSLSRLVSAKNPETGVISYNYDADGNLIARILLTVNTNIFGTYALQYCYDALNRKTAEYTGPTLIQNCTSPSQVLSTSGDTLMSAYTYDTTSLGTPPNNAIGELTDEVEYTAGTAVWERSPYQFDKMDRLLKEQQCAAASCTKTYPFTYGYDLSGNVLSTTNGLASGSPITVGYSYDAVARLATVSAVTPTTGIWAGNTFPATLYTAKEYGPAGLVSGTYGSSSASPMFLSRLYDKRLRVTDNTVASAATQASATVTVACINSGCTPGNGKAKVVIAGISVSASTTGTTMAALASSLATSINATDGIPVTANAPANSNVVTLTAIEYGKDGELSLTASTTSGATFTATASAANLGGDTSTTPYEFSLTYAANSNVAAATDTMTGSWTYTYDTLNRLTKANASTAGIVTPFGTFKTQCWTYDSFGNRTGEGEMTTAATCPFPISGSNHSNVALYNASNQLTSNSVSTFAYDQDGNILNDGINKYVYDLNGRICAVTTAASGGAITQYVYDADGRRVAKGSLTTFPAAGATCSAPTSANGFTATALYLRGEHGDQDTELNGAGVWQHTNVFAGGGLTATYDTGTKATFSFNFSDWLGSKRLQSNFNGTTQNSWASDPFGAYLKPLGSGADATEHHFTSKERDTETGNDYFGARYYESGIGRWVSPDWRGSPEAVPYANLDSPQTLNLYSYLENSPLGGVDGDGHCCWEEATGFAKGTWNFTKGTVKSLAILAIPVYGPMKIGSAIGDSIVYAGKEYYQKGISGVANEVLDQGEEGAMEIVTEAVLTGGAAAWGFKGPIEGAARGISGSTPVPEPYSRAAHYGNPSSSPTAKAIRAAGEGEACPNCGQTMKSGTRTAPTAEHTPTLKEHYYSEGYKMSPAERRAYARSAEGMQDEAVCKTCQSKQGAAESRKTYDKQ
jgi:RHS repeat-associated protein